VAQFKGVGRAAPLLALLPAALLLLLIQSRAMAQDAAVVRASSAREAGINPDGVVDAAGYGHMVAPGSIASVFGDFTPAPLAGATTIPLPVAFGNVSMQLGTGGYAPLFFVSGTQVNVQIPWEADWAAEATMMSVVNGTGSTPQPFSLVSYAPGIFTASQDGRGQGAILDLNYNVVDSSHPAKPGDVILIYCTGLGPVYPQPASGDSTPLTGLSSTLVIPVVTVAGRQAEVLFSGLAPGYVGLYQVNAVVPPDAPAGANIPVTISIGGATSNTATIAVNRPAMDSDTRAAQLVAQMTNAEKVQLIHGVPDGTVPNGAGGYVPGIPRLGIPDLYFVDGSAGVCNSIYEATALPSALASAATWDLALAYSYGAVIGKQMRSMGMNVNLGGNVNLNREPRNGRTFEAKGEDPILAGKINAAHIRATQDQHVIAGTKHFSFNDQETGRTYADVTLDERAARETDLLAFEISLKDSNAQSVMCSYNLWRGTYACENDHLLNGILKGDWGFKGFVMSDWWATHSTAEAANAGLDQEQPNTTFFGNFLDAVNSGQVSQARLDDMAHRIVRAIVESGLMDHPESTGPIDTAYGEAVAQTVEEQGAVLLKNANNQLPLDASGIHSIAVIGPHADIGVLSGGGSAQVKPTGGAALIEGQPCPPCWSRVLWTPSSPLAAIRAKAPGARVEYNSGSDPWRAATLAGTTDVAIVFLSQWASEGMDLPSLDFTDVIHSYPLDLNLLVSTVAAANPHTIVVLENGGAQTLPWLNQVNAVLEAWYPGQRGAEAIANILFGDVNPSGKLPVTFPASVNQLPHPTIAGTPDITTRFGVNYSEGLEVGYKWYDAHNLTPAFPFGFGLSYTTFEFSNASMRVLEETGSIQGTLSGTGARPAAVEPDPKAASAAPGGFQVSFDLKNTGSAAGAEVAQVYLGMPASSGEPPKRLVGWQKVFLKPGARQRVTIEVDANDSSHPLSYWDDGSHSWRIAPGEYVVYLGNSSASSSLTEVGRFQVSE